MSRGRGGGFRGRGGSSPRGGGRGRGRGGFRGGRFGGMDQGPPSYVVEMGEFMHACEGELVCSRLSSNDRIPYFNAPIYLENKTQIGKVEEILGSTTDVMFTVQCSTGVVASSFKEGDKVYISPDKLLPMSRFLPPPPGTKPAKRGGGARGGGRGGFGGRGGGRGGFGARGRGGGRGGFGARGGGRGGFGGRGGGRGGFGGRGGGRGRGRGGF